MTETKEYQLRSGNLWICYLNERALQDAGCLSDNVISTLQVGEEQTIDQALRSKANENIVNHFVSTIPAAERATISEAKGAINQQGLERLKLAIFAKTYTGNQEKGLSVYLERV